MDSLSSYFLPKLPINPLNRHHRPAKTTTTTSATAKATTPESGPLKKSSTPLPTHITPPPQDTRKPPSLPATLFNAFDNFINNFVDPPLNPSFDPRNHLAGNFAPVDELPPTECHVVEGSLPPSLDGAYIRNGPNPQFLPRGPYHFFDGDGMLHSIRISRGKATFCSRYVKTYKYKVEQEIGSPVIHKWFSGFNGLNASAARSALAAARVMAGQFDLSNGIGLANTSLALIAGRLYALAESDLPYSVKVDSDGEIHTLGRHDFDGKLVMSMTAHPKIDAETGETFAFRYGPVPPYLTMFRINANGEKQPDVPIRSVTSPAFMHDFAITQNYAIFNEIQIRMMTGSSLVGVDSEKVPRIGVIPRYATDESEMRWFEVGGFNPLHAINAWDEDGDGNTIVMVAPNMLSVEHTLERMDLVHALLEMVRIDLKNGVVTRHPLSARNLDLGVINPAYIGKKNRYVYAAIGDAPPKNSGVAKVDLSIPEDDRRDCIVATRIFGPGCYGGEPFFVARKPDNSNAEEDDGFVVTYVHNENTGESTFLVMNAASPDLDTVAAVRLPRRVPYGIHGLFVRDTDLDNL